MGADEGDVVCVGIVPRGRIVDWTPGSTQPNPAEWVPAASFSHILEACERAGIPLLSTLDVYAQTRICAADCKSIVTRWSDVEVALKGTHAEAPAAAVLHLIELCARGSQDTELLIEGP